MAKVFLVGAGCGGLDLLTLRAKECIEDAEVILYDRLINNKILRFAKKDAILIDVGKKNIKAGKSQNLINSLIIKFSKKYSKIVRLKGGDPFLFGRGGEEAEILKKNNVDFEIVPGISSILGASSYAGIPLTHRNFSSEVHIFSGNSKEKKINLDFKKIASLNGTIVFLMGLKNLHKIIEELINNGKDKKTKIAVIENGSTVNQRTLISTLDDILTKIKKDNFQSPVLTIIGEVVELNKNLKWFEKKPLFGKKILVTRAKKQSFDLSNELEKSGATVLELPVVKIIDNSNKIISREFINKLKNYSALLFCSANGVKFFFERIKMLGYDARILNKIKVGAVGEKTELELMKYNILADIVPKKFTVNELIKEAASKEKKLNKILILTSNVSPIKINELKKNYNIDFKKIEIYKNQKNKLPKKEIENILSKKIDLVIFLSSFTAKSFFDQIKFLDKNIKIASIGSETSAYIKKLNKKIDIEAGKYTINGLIESILKYYS